MASNVEQIQLQIKKTGLIAIMRGDFPLEQFSKIAEALAEADAPVMEITLNSQNALKAIETLRQRFAGSSLLIGAGTVRTAQQVDQAVAAGAQFIVSPNFDPAAVARSQTHDVFHLPGVFTPSEAHNAFVAGCAMLKLFPADALGPAYLKALRAPLNDIEFVPTGGIGLHNIADYVRAGAVALGIGSSLIAGANQPAQEILTKARALRSAWEQAHYE